MPQELMKVDYETEQGAQMSLDGATVRNYLVKGNGNVTDGEVMMFLHRCRDMRLDPFSSDVSLVKYGSDQPASIIVGKDAFPEFDGMEYGIVAMAADGTMSRREGAMTVPGEKLVGGWAKVWRKDRTRPSTAEVALAEYDTGRSSWRKMPATMSASDIFPASVSPSGVGPSQAAATSTTATATHAALLAAAPPAGAWLRRVSRPSPPIVYLPLARRALEQAPTIT